MRIKKIYLNPLRIYARLRFYMKSQYWDRETIERYQLKKVQSILLHAGAHVPYYRDLFRKERFDPQKFRSLKDLMHLPLLEKHTIRKDPGQFIADHKSTLRGYWRQTTGSTGTPLKLLIDREGHINKYAATLRAYHWAGYRPGRRALLLVEPDGLNRDFGYRLLSNSLFFDSRTVNRDNVQRFYPLLRRLRPNYYIGYGRAFLHLYKLLVELRLEIPEPRSIIHYGENLLENDRKKLETVYRTKVYDFYSHREDVVIAANPEPGAKYLMEDFFYPEIIDDAGQVTEEGTGELVGTGFYNYAMPLIRYRTTDILTIRPYDASSGRSFTRVDRIQGRMNDKIVTPAGREFYFMGNPLLDIPGIIAVQLIQDEIDRVRIKIMADDDFRMDSIARLKKNYAEYVQNQIVFDVEIVNEFEEQGRGKRPVIISRLA
jgi:phenylacetate-CoA ligase